jgi:hypothetical protein
VHKQKVTFENDIKVNGTLVKKGTYDVKFDDETGQLAIEKNGKTWPRQWPSSSSVKRKPTIFSCDRRSNGDETQLTVHLWWI